MNEIAKSNITQLLNSFETFVQIMEDPVWVKSSQVEDIKIAFKLGNFIEKSVQNFESKNILNEFLGILQKWWNINNRTKVYNVGYYQLACDHLLMKFFKFENVPENILDIAVRIYTSLYSKERMENVICHLILDSSSLSVVSQFLSTFIPETESKPLEYHFKLKFWSDIKEMGKENFVKNEINNMLSLYKVETNLYILIGILSLKDVSESEKVVQTIVVESVLEKMLDRSLLSKQFWLTLFKEVNIDVICAACKNYKEFLNSLFKFIIYIGSMMIKEQYVWISDSNISLCSEIGYYDLLRFIVSISKINSETAIFVTNKLLEAKEHTDSDIWDQVMGQIDDN